MKVDKESQTKTKEINENEFFTEATTQYLLLDKLDENLELNEIINENFEGDDIDGIKEKIKGLVGKIFQEQKGNINDSGGENSNEKTRL